MQSPKKVEQLNAESSIEERIAYAQQFIGKRFDRETIAKRSPLPPGSYFVSSASADNLRRYADGLGDLNLRFRDSEYARRTKYGRLVAQPTFLSAVCHPAEGIPETESPGVNGFHSASEWEYLRPVFEGDILDYNGFNLIDIKVIKSKFSGEMTAATDLVQYRNQRGEVVGIAKGTARQSVSNQAVKKIGKYDEIAKPYQYRDEEIAKIEEDKSKEERRGNWPRYWEDVAEGDPIGHLVIGPHTPMDSAAYTSAGAGHNRLFPAGPGMVYDPRINARTALNFHMDYDLGRTVGSQGASDMGIERECLASILFTNWMGDDAFLWKYSIQIRRFVVWGDTCWYRGKIVKKYIDDGKCCVDIEHLGENQRGDKVTAGQATIILPSKVHGEVKYPNPRSIEDIFPKKE